MLPCAARERAPERLSHRRGMERTGQHVVDQGGLHSAMGRACRVLHRGRQSLLAAGVRRGTWRLFFTPAQALSTQLLWAWLQLSPVLTVRRCEGRRKREAALMPHIYMKGSSRHCLSSENAARDCLRDELNNWLRFTKPSGTELALRAELALSRRRSAHRETCEFVTKKDLEE